MCGERLTTDLFVSTAERPGHVMRYCRERKAVFDNSSKPPTELRRRWQIEEEIHADQTLLAVLRQVPREADPQYVVTDPCRHIADPVSRQAAERGKLMRATFQGGEAACTEILRRPPR
ncbi:hypothetical protein TNCV_2772101 [Trichonephila clavipes]|nr:hypothetical protein TNCV_2772101 [Trichonephila clavipes]